MSGECGWVITDYHYTQGHCEFLLLHKALQCPFACTLNETVKMELCSSSLAYSYHTHNTHTHTPYAHTQHTEHTHLHRASSHPLVRQLADVRQGVILAGHSRGAKLATLTAAADPRVVGECRLPGLHLFSLTQGWKPAHAALHCHVELDRLALISSLGSHPSHHSTQALAWWTL